MNTLLIKVKDQFDKIHYATAFLNHLTHANRVPHTSLVQHIHFIEVKGEKILPSIELLFQSNTSSKIYKVLDA